MSRDEECQECQLQASPVALALELDFRSKQSLLSRGLPIGFVGVGFLVES